MAEHTELLPDPLPTEPLSVVSRWLADAWVAHSQPNPNSMVLATSTPDGRPSARLVLCKDIVTPPGYLVFYTNYRSSKGRQLQSNPRAAAVMHWDALHRQVRIEGLVTLAPASDSDAYFASRSLDKRLRGRARAQSEPVASRAALEAAVGEEARRLGTPIPGAGGVEENLQVNIPRPAHWGGYRLWVDAVELWAEGAARIHDRARWTRTLEPRAGAFTPGAWSVTRLQP
jgi:pyridoxamine 5'-phosphate oxidase